MYQLDRARKCKFTFGILAFVFLILCIVGYGNGGCELIEHGFMNEPLASIVMVVSLFCAVVCAVACITIHALEKDIAEWLRILETSAAVK